MNARKNAIYIFTNDIFIFTIWNPMFTYVGPSSTYHIGNKNNEMEKT